VRKSKIFNFSICLGEEKLGYRDVSLQFSSYHTPIAYCHTMLVPMFGHKNPSVTHWCFLSLHKSMWVLYTWTSNLETLIIKCAMVGCCCLWCTAIIRTALNCATMGEMKKWWNQILLINHCSQISTSISYLHILKIGFRGQHKRGLVYQISARNSFGSGECFKMIVVQ
jgi:hypothetical protein